MFKLHAFPVRVLLHQAVCFVLCLAGVVVADNKIRVENVTAAPGEENVLVAVLVDNGDPIDALSFVADYSDQLSLQDIVIEGTELGPQGVDAEYIQTIEEDGYFAVGVLVDWDEPYEERKLPAGVGQSAVVLHFQVSPEAYCGQELEVNLRRDMESFPLDSVFTVSSPGEWPETVYPDLQDGSITVFAAPKITAISPRGGTSGGTEVTVEGENLTPDTGVTFGGKAIEDKEFVDSGTIEGKTPSHGPAVVDVSVSNSCGEDTLEGAFTYAGSRVLIIDIAPSVGRTSGGVNVVVIGENFTENTQIKLGTKPAESVELVDSTRLNVRIPPHEAGAVDVVGIDGENEDRLVEAFHYVGPPTITSITPNAGDGGEVVTIKGTNFTTAEDITVLFGSQIATDIEVISPTELTCRFPECGGKDRWVSVSISTATGFFPVTQGYNCGGSVGPTFRRGDANCDSKLDIADALTALGHLFEAKSVLCMDAVDTNDDGAIDIGDVIFLLNALFSGGERPPDPGYELGTDPTPDGLDCEQQCGT